MSAAPLSQDELEELAAGHALDALSAEDRARFEAALEAQPEAATALARARVGAAALGATLAPVKPRPEVWSAIEAQLDAGAGADAAGDAGRPARRGRGGLVRQVLPWAVAALAAALALLFWRRSEDGARRSREAARLAAFRAAEVATRDRELTAQRGVTAECRRDLDAMRDDLALKEEAVALLEHASTRVVALNAQGGRAHGGSAIVNLEQKRVVIVATGLTVEAGKDYELWVIRGEHKLAAGLLHGGERGQAIARVDPALLGDGADALAVTLEPAGGGPVPQGPVVLLGVMPKS